MPVARRVCHTVKKLLDTFAMMGETRTWKTVLVEYPRRDAWMVAFIVGEIPSEDNREELVSVFVPNAPNSAAGRDSRGPACRGTPRICRFGRNGVQQPTYPAFAAAR